MEEFSKTQIDKLGERLKNYLPTNNDLILLDKYRRSFRTAYDEVILRIKYKIKLDPSGRPAKSTNSIIEKLKRESIRLTQIQDIAGCRIVLPNIAEQDHTATALMKTFPGSDLIDRREHPSFGYRALHVVALIAGKPVEIQIRTHCQHIWAEISEKFSDIYGSKIKYGGGDENIRQLLINLTTFIETYEKLELGEKINDDLKKQIEKKLEVLLEMIGGKFK